MPGSSVSSEVFEEEASQRTVSTSQQGSLTTIPTGIGPLHSSTVARSVTITGPASSSLLASTRTSTTATAATAAASVPSAPTISSTLSRLPSTETSYSTTVTTGQSFTSSLPTVVSRETSRLSYSAPGTSGTTTNIPSSTASRLSAETSTVSGPVRSGIGGSPSQTPLASPTRYAEVSSEGIPVTSKYPTTSTYGSTTAIISAIMPTEQMMTETVTASSVPSSQALSTKQTTSPVRSSIGGSPSQMVTESVRVSSVPSSQAVSSKQRTSPAPPSSYASSSVGTPTTPGAPISSAAMTSITSPPVSSTEASIVAATSGSSRPTTTIPSSVVSSRIAETEIVRSIASTNQVGSTSILPSSITTLPVSISRPASSTLMPSATATTVTPATATASVPSATMTSGTMTPLPSTESSYAATTTVATSPTATMPGSSVSSEVFEEEASQRTVSTSPLGSGVFPFMSSYPTTSEYRPQKPVSDSSTVGLSLLSSTFSGNPALDQAAAVGNAAPAIPAAESVLPHVPPKENALAPLITMPVTHSTTQASRRASEKESFSMHTRLSSSFESAISNSISLSQETKPVAIPSQPEGPVEVIPESTSQMYSFYPPVQSISGEGITAEQPTRSTTAKPVSTSKASSAEVSGMLFTSGFVGEHAAGTISASPNLISTTFMSPNPGIQSPTAEVPSEVTREGTSPVVTFTPTTHTLSSSTNTSRMTSTNPVTRESSAERSTYYSPSRTRIQTTSTTTPVQSSTNEMPPPGEYSATSTHSISTALPSLSVAATEYVREEPSVSSISRGQGNSFENIEEMSSTPHLASTSAAKTSLITSSFTSSSQASTDTTVYASSEVPHHVSESESFSVATPLSNSLAQTIPSSITSSQEGTSAHQAIVALPSEVMPEGRTQSGPLTRPITAGLASSEQLVPGEYLTKSTTTSKPTEAVSQVIFSSGITPEHTAKESLTSSFRSSVTSAIPSSVTSGVQPKPAAIQALPDAEPVEGIPESAAQLGPLTPPTIYFQFSKDEGVTAEQFTKSTSPSPIQYTSGVTTNQATDVSSLPSSSLSATTSEGGTAQMTPVVGSFQTKSPGSLGSNEEPRSPSLAASISSETLPVSSMQLTTKSNPSTSGSLAQTPPGQVGFGTRGSTGALPTFGSSGSTRVSSMTSSPKTNIPEVATNSVAPGADITLATSTIPTTVPLSRFASRIPGTHPMYAESKAEQLAGNRSPDVSGCQLTLSLVNAVKLNAGDLVGWVEKNGIDGYQDTDVTFHVGDSLDVGVVVHLLSSCNNCTCTENYTLSCTRVPCAQHCSWGSWTSWSECSQTCGAGMRFRNRDIRLPALHGGDQCLAADGTQSEMCHQGDCPVSCQWSVWSGWSACTRSCGGGFKQRTRNCDNSKHPECSCGDEDKEIELCNNKQCPGATCTGNKVWTEDCTEYPACPATCCDLGKDSCVPPDTCESACRCPKGTYENQNGDCVPKEQCECCVGLDVYPVNYTSSNACTDCVCASGVLQCIDKPCPVDCQWAVWEEWSPCSVLCDVGLQYRSRSKIVPASNGGKECVGEERETRECNLQQCATCIDDKGNEHRQLATFNETECSYCICNSNLAITCLDKVNSKVDGGWSKWSEWSVCSRSCGPGTKTRTRICSDPEPACGGAACSGNTVDIVQCNMGICNYRSRAQACQLYSYPELIVLTDEAGRHCESTSAVMVTMCKGSCSSYDDSAYRLKNTSNSELAVHDSSCRCCQGVGEYKPLTVLCGDTEREAEVYIFTRCKCHTCQGDTTHTSSKLSCDEIFIDYVDYLNGASSVLVTFSGSPPKAGCGYEQSLFGANGAFIPDVNHSSSILQVNIIPKDTRSIYVEQLIFVVEGAQEISVSMLNWVTEAQVEKRTLTADQQQMYNFIASFNMIRTTNIKIHVSPCQKGDGSCPDVLIRDLEIHGSLCKRQSHV